ncbi:MAG: hypothetical protein JSR61_14570 [Proteobacteria bacterium]|nr:hypothetical protein [Pseudomonadota bacterium]
MRWLFLLAALLVAGCASDDVGPSPAELKARWDAQNVLPQNYKSDLVAFMRTYLNDPQHVRNAQASRPTLKALSDDNHQRFIVCVRFRERQAAGTYAAAKEGYATFVSGKLDRYVDTPKDVAALCKDASLEPFPELEKLPP